MQNLIFKDKESVVAPSTIAHASSAIHVSQQQGGTIREQSTGKGENQPSSGNGQGKPVDDTVTLSATAKLSTQSAELDAKGVEDVLPRAKAAILSGSKAALAAQANVETKVAREMLADR